MINLNWFLMMKLINSHAEGRLCIWIAAGLNRLVHTLCECNLVHMPSATWLVWHIDSDSDNVCVNDYYSIFVVVVVRNIILINGFLPAAKAILNVYYRHFHIGFMSILIKMAIWYALIRQKNKITTTTM